MKYFNLYMPTENAKALYYKLCIEMHPDKNPSKEGAVLEFAEMKEEYKDYEAIMRRKNEITSYFNKKAPVKTIQPTDVEKVLSKGIDLLNISSKIFKEVKSVIIEFRNFDKR